MKFETHDEKYNGKKENGRRIPKPNKSQKDNMG